MNKKNQLKKKQIARVNLCKPVKPINRVMRMGSPNRKQFENKL